MKRVIVLVVVVFFAGGVALSPAQEAQESGEPESPRGAVNFILAGSWAPFGLGVEAFLGPLGLGGTFTALPFGAGGDFIILYEPGAYARFYFSNPESALFASASTSYLSVTGGSPGDLDVLDARILRLNGSVGYNAFFGRDNSTRFAFELGPRFNTPIVGGASQDSGWIFVHFMLMFGKTF
ncbi:MAG: hypothetical protein ACOCXE_00345 [Spirochaetota bacterium]